MAVGYTDTPHNMEEIVPYIVTEKDKIAAEIFQKSKCYFYDTCSFQRHANLKNDEMDCFFEYVKEQNGIVIITRCIMMELASHSGILNQEYIEYIRHMNEFGITILVMFEEDLFSVMEICFSTNKRINEYLCWAVRVIHSPISTITETLEKNSNICDEVIKGKNISMGGLYQRFFEAVRANKESGDDLGEELLAICLYILSQIPGERDGKFCVITDDKGAAGKIDNVYKKTAKPHRGCRFGIFSTPKLMQLLYREKILKDKELIKKILSAGTNGNIVVLGTCIFDIRNREISLTSDELADLIIKPNGINIVF